MRTLCGKNELMYVWAMMRLPKVICNWSMPTCYTFCKVYFSIQKKYSGSSVCGSDHTPTHCSAVHTLHKAFFYLSYFLLTHWFTLSLLTEEGPGFESWPCSFLCGVCMFSFKFFCFLPKSENIQDKWTFPQVRMQIYLPILYASALWRAFLCFSPSACWNMLHPSMTQPTTKWEQTMDGWILS